MTSPTSGSRQRRSPSTKSMAEIAQETNAQDMPPASPATQEEVVWGKTPGGEGAHSAIGMASRDAHGISSPVFRVPTTHDVLTTLFHPAHPKSHIDLFNLLLLGSQVVLFFCVPRAFSKAFFLVYFAFWRAAYDAGLGWVLTKQSKKKWIVKEVQRRGWLDENKRPKTRAWIRNQLAGKMGKDYSFDVSIFPFRPLLIPARLEDNGISIVSSSDERLNVVSQDLPLEYNTWLLYRQLVDIILLKLLSCRACSRAAR
jgi:phosphatidylethanolamine N-methyltransferase